MAKTSAGSLTLSVRASGHVARSSGLAAPRRAGDVPRARPQGPTVAKAVYVKPVGSFVPRLTRKAFEKYGFSAATLLTDWARIVGAELAAYAVPDRLKWPRAVETYGTVEDGAEGRPGATLMLRVDGGRALDVEYGRRQIIERINAYFGYRAVAEIKILQAPIAPARTTALQRRPVGHAPVQPQPAAPAPQIDAVADGGLRDALARMQARMSAERPQATSGPRLA